MSAAGEKQRWHVDILVADGFVLTEVAGIVDAMRIANRVAAFPPFTWTYRSAFGGVVESGAEVCVKAESFAQKPEADYAFVIGNADPDCPALSVGTQIDRYTFRGAQVFLLAEAASRYIKERGYDGSHLSTHWENSDVLRERSGLFEAGNAIATEDGLVVTCAGMGATVDVMLAVLRRHISSANLMTVANVLLHEKIRDFSTRQPLGGARSSGSGDRELDQCLQIMQANIEDPIPISELVKVLGISARSLERKFRTHLNTTPNTHYRELRLARANNLLLNTNMSVREVGLACGFPSGFSGLYKGFFGITPFALRKQRRLGTISPQDLGKSDKT
ncbi:helix-turn-helix domain-containing protein [Tropicibacter sp. R15_0]|uniref:GlxA family transcriptional regulator n=1 Tax=Tropicibacter sp. R15_0 TaxID=2821101 RepID=UPI001ADB4E12|nr:helix-turn-helix domain-containing protein [Tropicibacter sp. R15_0]MBO9466370.1 helix-turn-helix domain-containing protein [Tropicibacter sp. R15_0]